MLGPNDSGVVSILSLLSNNVKTTLTRRYAQRRNVQ